MNSVWFVAVLLAFAAVTAIPWERWEPKPKEERGGDDGEMLGQRLPLSAAANSNEANPSVDPTAQGAGTAQTPACDAGAVSSAGSVR